MSPDRVSDADLLALAAGSLEPDRSYEVRHLLRLSPELAQRYRGLRRALRGLVGSDRPRWSMPPVGVAAGLRPFRLSAPVPADLGDEGAVFVGQRLVFTLDRVDDPARRTVLLLRADGASWDLVFPDSATSELRISELPAGEGGARRLEIVVQGPPGPQRWGIALAPEGLLDWTSTPEERLERVRAGVRRGTISVQTYIIEVKENDEP